MSTRRELLLGGVGGAVALAAPDAARAAASTGTSSAAAVTLPERLQRLARLEMLLLFCYRHVLGSSVLSPRARRTLAPFVAHEQAHIHALERQLSARGAGLPAPPDSVQAANRDLARRNVSGRLGQLQGDLDAVRLLLRTEQVMIGAYFVALQTLDDPDLIELVCQMMANDAQHDAMLGLLLPPGTPGSAAPYGLVQGLQ